MSPRASASRSNPSPDRAQPDWTLQPDAGPGPRRRLAEIWDYRRVLWFFAVKSAQRVYANTQFPVLVFLVRSVVPIFAAAVVFGGVMNVSTPGVPYFLFLLTGSTIWACLDGPLMWATRALEMNRQLLTKLYLPRIILPAAQMSAGLIDVVVPGVVIVAAVCYYRYADGVWYAALTPRLLLIPCVMFLVLLLAFSLSLWTSVWQARARDMRFILGYVMSFWYLLTPIVYPASTLPGPARWAAALNPMTGPVETFKWAVLGIGTLPAYDLAFSTAATAGLFLGGVAYFSKTEGVIVDRL